jgi:hypothetical protein
MPKEGESLEENNLNNIKRATDAVNKVIWAPDFTENAPDLIYEALISEIKPVSVSDDIKKHLFAMSSLEGDFSQFAIKIYEDLLISSFEANRVPFPDSSPEQFAKRILAQGSISRDTAFLLAFGLSMSVAQVSGFLMNSLRGRDFNLSDTSEAICWRCLSAGLPFSEALLLKGLIADAPPSSTIYKTESEAMEAVKSAPDFDYLTRVLINLKGNRIRPAQTVANAKFKELFQRAQGLFESADEGSDA